MKKIFSLFLFLAGSYYSIAQNTFSTIVKNSNTKEILSNASAAIPALHLTSNADSNGIITITQIPDGKYKVVITYVGYNPTELLCNFPLKSGMPVPDTYLQPLNKELEEVTVQSTRTNQNLRDIPTRIEALPLEELEEKSTERPGDIKMLLSETTGIHVQQSSATSGTANIRIQGLDSRYTQLLQDGMPLYTCYSGNLSLLQTNPLDLKQVEMIKGPAATLFGGGAIAGLVNLISRTPEKAPKLNFIINGTNAKGADASVFYSERRKYMGTTLLSSFNYNDPYDPAGNGFSAIPEIRRFTINPKLFLFPDGHNSGWFGINTTVEKRYGGDMQVLSGHADSLYQYFEQNNSFRFSTQLSFTHIIDAHSRINVKNTVGFFKRELGEAGFTLKGSQLSSFSEVNYVHNSPSSDWVAGANFITDHFTAKPPQDSLSYHLNTMGLFVQNTWRAIRRFSLETGIRLDKNTPAPEKPSSGYFVLPRINALFKLNHQFSSRIGGGLGYKMPSLFNDMSEQEGYQNLKPLNTGTTKAEQSYGLNADLNFRALFGENYSIRINQMFFYTYVDQPLILQQHSFVNAPGHLDTKGTETNIKLNFDELVFYLGYTLTDTRQIFNGLVKVQPLTPANQINFDCSFEAEGNFRIGGECFYTGPQLLSDGTTGRGYVTMGLLVQKSWKHLDVFINGEDLTDVRQTRWGSIYTGSRSQPVFKDIFAPLEGRVINLGVRIKVLD